MKIEYTTQDELLDLFVYGDGDGDGTGDEGGDNGGAGDDDKDKGGKGGKEGDDDKKISDEQAKLLKEVMRRKEAQKKAETDLEATKAQMKQLQEALGGLKIEEVRDLIKSRKDEETRKLEEKGQFDEVKKQMREQHAAAMKELQDKLDALSGEIKGRDSKIEELTVGSAFSSSTFIKEGLVVSPAITRTIFGPHFDVDVAEGKIVGYDKPRGAKDRAPLVDADGNSLSFDQALEKLVSSHQDAATLIKAKGKPGAGSGTQVPGKSGKADDQAEMTGRERIAAALAAKNKAGKK